MSTVCVTHQNPRPALGKQSQPSVNRQLLDSCTVPSPPRVATFLATVPSSWRHPCPPASVSRHELGMFLVCKEPRCMGIMSQSAWGPAVEAWVLALGWVVLVYMPVVCFVGGSGRGGSLRKGKEISSALLKTEIRNYQFRVSGSHSAWLPSAVLFWNDLVLFWTVWKWHELDKLF